MQASSRWILDYLPLKGPFKEVLPKLVAAGIEVGNVQEAGAGLSKVIVAQLMEVAKHPQADRLSLTKVSTGSETLQVVCGAKNIAPGQKVPLALVGASLPGLDRLEMAKIRGVESFGMMCSAKELGLAADADGIYLLPEDAPVGADLKDYLGLPDTLFEVELTPNRADLLSHYGLARELGALLKLEPKFPAEPKLVENGAEASLKVGLRVEDPTGCPFYSCRLLEGIQVGPSPRWLKEKLERLGQKSINNVVDVTNFILFELGQPLHTFDFDLLEGHQIVVRRAKSGERIPLLDGTEKELNPDVLVIADSRKPVALAGVMGGSQSMVSAGTKNILLEAALFQPGLVRRTARRLGISTDSSYRFERGIDHAGVLRALDRAAALIQQVAGGEILKGIVLSESGPLEPKTVVFRPARCNKVLGIQLSAEAQYGFLAALGCRILPEGDTAQVTLPTWRVDLNAEIDLIEEVARMNGYDRLPLTAPPIRVSPSKLPEVQRPLRSARRAFQRHGLTEAVNTSFLPPDFADRLKLPPGHPFRSAHVLVNPIAEDQAVMRPTLVPSLLANVKLNLSFQQDGAAFFEVNKAFLPQPGGTLTERLQVGAVLAGAAAGTGWENPSRNVDFFDLKGLAADALAELAPGAALAWEYGQEGFPYRTGVSFRVLGPGNTLLAWGGELDPKVKKAYDIAQECFAVEVNLEACWAAARKGVTVTPLPKFPEARRDLALVVPDERSNAEIESLIRETGGPSLVETVLFDLYRGKNLPEGRRSLAYRLSFQSPDRTLTDAEVAEQVERIVDTLQKRYAVALR